MYTEHSRDWSSCAELGITFILSLLSYKQKHVDGNFQDFEATHEIVQAPLWTGGTSVSAVNVQKLSCTVENFCFLKLSRLLDSDKAQQRRSSLNTARPGGTQQFS